MKESIIEDDLKRIKIVEVDNEEKENKIIKKKFNKKINSIIKLNEDANNLEERECKLIANGVKEAFQIFLKDVIKETQKNKRKTIFSDDIESLIKENLKYKFMKDLFKKEDNIKDDKKNKHEKRIEPGIDQNITSIESLNNKEDKPNKHEKRIEPGIDQNIASIESLNNKEDKPNKHERTCESEKDQNTASIESLNNKENKSNKHERTCESEKDQNTASIELPDKKESGSGHLKEI